MDFILERSRYHRISELCQIVKKIQRLLMNFFGDWSHLRLVECRTKVDNQGRILIILNMRYPVRYRLARFSHQWFGSCPSPASWTKSVRAIPPIVNLFITVSALRATVGSSRIGAGMRFTCTTAQTTAYGSCTALHLASNSVFLRKQIDNPVSEEMLPG
jgi:hypothetical protein